MKSLPKTFSVVTAAACTLFLVACDWSSGGSSNSFNTSNASNLSNISGFYQGTSSNEVVRGSGISHLTVQQSGTRLEVVDSRGNRYTGSVGAPLLVANLREGSSISAGAQVASYQLSFSGNGVEFTGVVNLISVSDILGNTRNVDDDHNTTDSSTTSSSSSTTTTSETVIPPQQGVDGVEPGSTTESENTTGGSSERTRESTRSDSRSSYTEFELTDANTQLRMRGTWIQNGRASSLDARAAGIMGNISTDGTGGTGGTGGTTGGTGGTSGTTGGGL